MHVPAPTFCEIITIGLPQGVNTSVAIFLAYLSVLVAVAVIKSWLLHLHLPLLVTEIMKTGGHHGGTRRPKQGAAG